MVKVTVNRANPEPQEPPIESVVLTLSEDEARRLCVATCAATPAVFGIFHQLRVALDMSPDEVMHGKRARD